MSTELALWLNQEAVRKNLSLRDVAKLAGVSHTTVIEIANGERTNPEAKTVTGLARAFGTDPIEYLRNGGNVLALQASLGHSSLEMVRVYARVAQADLENGHRVASPVENWRL